MRKNQLPSLEEWVDSHEGLNNKTTELFESELPVDVQAKKALDYLVQTFNLVVMPEDVEDRDGVKLGDGYFYPISMYEQIAQLKFADPENNDPRYLVMMAAYLLQHHLSIDFAEQMEAYLGGKEPQGLGYRGESIFDVEMILVKKGESWFDLGCSLFIKQLN